MLGLMSIEYCPVLTPTWKEFRNFSTFVEKIDKIYKKDYGMVKVSFSKGNKSSIPSHSSTNVGNPSSWMEANHLSIQR